MIGPLIMKKQISGSAPANANGGPCDLRIQGDTCISLSMGQWDTEYVDTVCLNAVRNRVIYYDSTEKG